MTDPGRAGVPDRLPPSPPGLDTVGVMLAYTPLHHLLLDAVGPAARDDERQSRATSRSRPGTTTRAARWPASPTPSCCTTARSWRATTTRCVRVAGDAPLLPAPRARVRAAAAASCRSRRRCRSWPSARISRTRSRWRTGGRAFVSQHIGDLENLETLEHFYATLARVPPPVPHRPAGGRARPASGLPVDPRGRRARARAGHRRAAPPRARRRGARRAWCRPIARRRRRVRRHGLRGRRQCVGRGVPGRGSRRLRRASAICATPRCRAATWPCGRRGGRRSATCRSSRQPPGAFAAAFAGVAARERYFATQQIAHGLNAPLASSMGRLFDAAAAVLGVRRVAQYEGQAAMELEALAGTASAAALPFPWTGDGAGGWALDPLPLLVALGERRRPAPTSPTSPRRSTRASRRRPPISRRQAAALAGTRTVALAGGCFQNVRLLASLRTRLEAARAAGARAHAARAQRWRGELRPGGGCRRSCGVTRTRRS